MEISQNFSGKLDLDNNNYKVKPNDFIDSWNITRDSQEAGQDKVVSQLVSNRLSYYALPSGVNKVIGKKEDLERNRIYFFVWNSDNNHLILFYDKVSDTVIKLLGSQVDSAGIDILRFNPSFKINHIDIIYRDIAEGDLIYFTDGQDGNVFCIDTLFISDLISNSVPIKREFIQMAKQTSQIAPFCFYEDDLTVTVNNLRKNVFKFKVRYVYNDLTKSVTSSQGVLSLPVNQDLSKDDASKNSKISIAVLTGEKNVRKVEILAAYNIGNVFSDYFTVKVIDKDVLGLADNDVYVYPFYNNEAYTNILVEESVQLFDYVPQSAYTQASANGNTIEYANIKEGYDLLNIWNNNNGSVDSSIVDYLSVDIRNTTEFGNVKAYQGGSSGYGSTVNNGDITIVVFGNFKVASTFNMFTYNGVTNTSVTYTNTADETASQFRNGIEAQAVSAGFTVISNTGYNGQVLVIRKANTNLISSQYNNAISSLNSTNYKGVMPVYDWWSRYSFGLVYFDEKDRTNGVVYPTLSTIQTDGYNVIGGLEQMQQVLATIWNKPPNWAAYYHIVRTKNLAKSWFVQWISDITLKEIGASAVDNSYAYIGINPLNAFIAENPSSNFLGYSFVEKDRIRLIKSNNNTPIVVTSNNPLFTILFNGNAINIPISEANAIALGLSVGDTILISGTVSNNIQFTISALTYSTGLGEYSIFADSSIFTSETILSFSFKTLYYSSKDFEILQLTTNPTINGIDYVGSYVKIMLPKTGSSFDFGNSNFYNYFFEIYRPAVPTQGDLNLYYEFGERYMIANAGTILALHQGQETQKVDSGGVVTSPASITMFSGDDYGRYRDISIAPRLKWSNISKESVSIDFGATEPVGSFHDLIPSLNLSPITFNYIGITPNTVSLEYNPDLSSSSNNIISIDTFGVRTFDINVYSIIDKLRTFPFRLELLVLGVDVSGAVIQSEILYSRDFYPTPGYIAEININNNISLTTTIATKKIYILFRATLLLFNHIEYSFKFDIKAFKVNVSEKSNILKQFCIDPNVSDYYASAVNSNGRKHIHDINAKQQIFPTTLRFGLEYQQNTNINRTNRFYYENLDDYDRSSGDIKKLYVDGRRLYVLQQFNIGVVPILQQIVKTASGDSLLTQNDTLLNKIQYPYQGKVGIGNVPESFAYNKHAIYGISDVKGVAWRLSQNGIDELSVIYECDNFFKRQLTAYSSTLNNGYPETGQPYLGNPTVYGGFDLYGGKVIWAFEEINRYDISGGLLFHQDPKTIIFNESRDESEGFECFTNYYPESIGSLGTLLATFKDGSIYTHDDTSFNTFYGNSFESSITPVFRGNEIQKKSFVSLMESASDVWDCPSIETQLISHTTVPQQSKLVANNFARKEGQFHAPLLRDINSAGGWVNGSSLKGNYIIIKFRNAITNKLVFLSSAIVKFNNSQLNNK